ncbi:hypothetical protein AGMMS50233_05430 [Endomicrobiia bacterium]|nr:hypothetical protein AGMMS50233_05430 [Endomicrobiia bacterium]
MKQKKKTGGSDGMGLILIGVKKGTFDKTKDSKDRTKEQYKIDIKIRKRFGLRFNLGCRYL